MPTFPSEEWMQAYAMAVAEHPSAHDLSEALSGRFRFVISSGGDFGQTVAYDLAVDPGARFKAEVADDAEDATLVITADYPRWKALITGKADFVMSFLMRKVKIEGNLGAIRERLRDARPLVECLHEVPSTFDV